MNHPFRSCYNLLKMNDTDSETKNLHRLMRQRLPAKLFNRLLEVGALAEQMGVSAFLVGGLVRDLLLGRRNFDGVAKTKAEEWRFGEAVRTIARNVSFKGTLEWLQPFHM